ncbi:MAG: hypothetical protein ABMB14_20145 [Myxococcota bacterium]
MLVEAIVATVAGIVLVGVAVAVVVGRRRAAAERVGAEIVPDGSPPQPVVAQPVVAPSRDPGSVGGPSSVGPSPGSPAVGQPAVGQPAVGQPAVGQPGPALVPVGSDAAANGRWVAVLAATAPLATLGLYLHHRRFVDYHRRKGTEPKTTFSRWVAAETRGAGTLASWYVRGFLRDGLRVPARSAGRVVLCIHGYTQNATNFHGLRQVLEADGRPTVAVSLGYRLAPLSWYARRLERALDGLVGAQNPDGIDVVAHSMGGVVLRMVLADRPDLRPALRTVVTLGTPHRGTAATRGLGVLPELRALHRRSTLLAGLPQLPALIPDAKVVTIAGDADTVVYPVETSLVTGAHKVVLPGVGHAGLLTTPPAWDAVRRALSDEAPPQPAPSQGLTGR